MRARPALLRRRAVADTSAAFESRIRALEPWLWALALGVCRLPFFPLTEQDVDGANFARAVEQFDLSAWAPHPPGYPVFIAAAKAIRAVCLDDPARALAAVALVSSIVFAASVFAVIARVFDRSTARITTLLLLCSPLITLFSVRPLSDGPGVAIAWAALALSLRAFTERSEMAAIGTIVLAALLPGVRASALPFVLPSVFVALWSARRRWLIIAAGILATAAYLVPFLMLVDVGVLFGRTAAHAHGHFSDYGGSVFSSFDPVARFNGVLRAFWAHGLAGVWANRPASTLLTTAALIVLLPFVRANRLSANESGRVLARAVGVYFLWIAIGQNIVEQPRHILPLVPVVISVVAYAAKAAFARIEVRFLRRSILVLGACAALWESSRLGFLQGRYPAHIVRISRYVSNEPDHATLTVATCRFYRWIGWRAPGVRVVSVGNLDEARALLKSAPGRVLVTSEVPGAEALDPGSTVLRVAADPFVRYVFEDVRVLELR
jgi:hypothetical protein